MTQRKVPPLAQSLECPLRFAPCLPEPERIVGIGFRYWLLGLTTGEIQYWERAWSVYSGVFGVAGGRESLLQLSAFVRAVCEAAGRDITVLPASCRSFCRDECMAIALVAACQHDRHDARTCALALTASDGVESVVRHADALARTLLSLDHRLSLHSVSFGTPDAAELSASIH